MNAMSNGPRSLALRKRVGDWLPGNESTVAEFRLSLWQRVQQEGECRPLTTPVQRLRRLLQDDPGLRMGLTQAIAQAREAGYVLGYGDIDELLRVVDYLMAYAPPFSDSTLVVCPLNAVLDWLMCMPSGYAVFRHPEFNRHLQSVLDAWSAFLGGPHSRMHLHGDSPEGWFSPEADKKIGLDQFVTHPDLPYRGFHSWNDFFTRRFRPGQRPVEGEGDDRIVVSPCEAKPFAVRRDVKLVDQFWIKSQPYSLRDMFGADEADLARRFVGGTVYQAYLSAYSYHRWHAPISGTVVKVYRIPGTYYSCAEAEGPDPEGLNDSQGYTSAMATRVVVAIEPSDPALGTVACLFIGIAEVSSCVAEVMPGQRVNKGEEIGRFQYGGSTVCIVFEPGKVREIAWDPDRIKDPPVVKVNSRVGVLG